MKHITIDGNRFDDIVGFYAEINRVFMAGEEWQLGQSLDAFNDLLYGSYGALKGADCVRLHWIAIGKSRDDLGVQCTLNWLAAKLNSPGPFNLDLINAQMDALKRGEGETFYQIVLSILADHPKIELVAS
ncbi:ribonuclease inhibitor [Rhizobium sp. CFBP 8762]|uniref:ribonuclease inhibitor n=1 Tax=Rhizobium sp. CFBP 8762 TaxID=2775279 RepID=UPI0018D66822|nr:ribonuclease inhibitor [Rhizobium sp. CFBP 8762]